MRVIGLWVLVAAGCFSEEVPVDGGAGAAGSGGSSAEGGTAEAGLSGTNAGGRAGSGFGGRAVGGAGLGGLTGTSGLSNGGGGSAGEVDLPLLPCSADTPDWCVKVTVGMYGGPVLRRTDAGDLYVAGQRLSVTKLDPQGALLWDNSWGDEFFTTFAVDPSGDLVLLGWTGVPGLETYVDKHYFLAKASAEGELLWKHEIERAGSFLTVDPTGNVWVPGGNYVAQYSSAGEESWQKDIPGVSWTFVDTDGVVEGSDRTTLMSKLSEDGEVIETYVLPFDYAPELLVGPDGHLFAFRRFESRFEWMDAKTAETLFTLDFTDAYTSIDSLAVDRSGNVYLLVHTFDSAPHLEAYTAQGELLWKKELSVDGFATVSVNNIVPGDDGDLYIGGQTYNSTEGYYFVRHITP